MMSTVATSASTTQVAISAHIVKEEVDTQTNNKASNTCIVFLLCKAFEGELGNPGGKILHHTWQSRVHLRVFIEWVVS